MGDGGAFRTLRIGVGDDTVLEANFVVLLIGTPEDQGSWSEPSVVDMGM